eukprot:scaffold15512_cov73-Cylindrotheca_fusiformis.AAC.1
MSFNVVCTVALSIPNILQRATSSVLEILSLSIELRYCGALDSTIPSVAVSSHGLLLVLMTNQIADG